MIAGIHQGDLFTDAATPHPSSSLMPVLDKINRKMGKGTIKLASDGIDPGWTMKTGNKSPAYTTRWDELPVVS
jgi:DNA polymerase V